jgi:hypothetical protein
VQAPHLGHFLNPGHYAEYISFLLKRGTKLTCINGHLATAKRVLQFLRCQQGSSAMPQQVDSTLTWLDQLKVCHLLYIWHVFIHNL